MTRFAAALPLLLTAGAAMAHEGAHLHPHEAQGWFATALIFGLSVLVPLGATVAACVLVRK